MTKPLIHAGDGPGASNWMVRLFARSTIVLAGLAFSLLAWYHLDSERHNYAVTELDHKADIVTRNIERAVQRYMDFLFGYRAFFNASESIDRSEFAFYIESIQKTKRYAGLQALSFARRVAPAERQIFEQQVRRELGDYAPNLSDFKIHPPSTGSEAFPIEFTEPLLANAPSLGLDLAMERQRLLSVQRARDTAQPIATGVIQLLQDERRNPAFALRLALYSGSSTPLDLVQRRERFYGVINAVVIVEELLRDVIPSSMSGSLLLKISDSRPGSDAEPTLMHVSQPVGDDERLRTAQHLTKTVKLNVGGRYWLLEFSPVASAEITLGNHLPEIVLAGGLVGTFLLYLLINSLMTQNRRSMAFARSMNSQLTEKQEQMQIMADIVPVAILLIDPEDRSLISVNEKAIQWLRLGNYSSGKSNLTDCILSSEELNSLIERALKNGYSKPVEIQLESISGETLWTQVSANTTALGGKQALLLSMSDISEQKQAEERIRYLAHYDALTGLANRNLMNERIDYLIAESRRDQRKIGIMLLDLDRFKDINDTLGHGAGDKLLNIFASRISSQVRETDLVSRMGGDEFVIVAPHFKQTQDLAVLAEKILRIATEPCVLSGTEVHPTTSIGISLFPEDGDNREVLLGNADTAMYHAKSAGRNRYQFFTAAMNQEVQERVTLERELRNAIQRRELLLHYQPQVDACTGKIRGVEALLRWERDDGRSISPSTFIPVAEDSGIIHDLGIWVLKEACRQGRSWYDAGYQHLRIAVNISPRQFLQGNFHQIVSEVLAETGLPPTALEIEVTEGVLLEQEIEASTTLAELHRLGVSIAVDDFGTGYSSLSYLKRFPIDCIKIDRSFIRDLETDPEDRSIVCAIIAMADSLGLRLIAEGVENHFQANFLQTQGVRDLQGFYFAHPMPTSQLISYLRGAIRPRSAAV